MKCPKCLGSWEQPKGKVIEACPFCQHSLKTETKADLNSPEGILLKIVGDFTQEIYQDTKKFSSLLADYFVHDKKTLKILTAVLEHGGAKAILAFTQKTQGDFELNRRKLVLKIADDTLIPNETIEIGVNLLCSALGKQGETTYAEKTIPLESTPPSPKSQTPPVPSHVEEPESEPEHDEFYQILQEAKLEKNVRLPALLLVVPERAFINNKLIETVKIGYHTTTIEKVAFGGCSNLKEVVFSDNLSTIEEYAFAGCCLKELFIPKNVKKIKEFAFASCTALEKVVIESSDTKIDPMAFHETPWYKNKTQKATKKSKQKPVANTSPSPQKRQAPTNTTYTPEKTKVAPTKTTYTLEETKALMKTLQNQERVLIPEGVTEIPARAFYQNCTIKSVVMSNTVTEINENAFYRCDNLRQVTFSKALKKVGYNAFYDVNLKEVNLPEGLLEIRSYAFTLNYAIERIVIPSSVTEVYDNAFYFCDSLSEVVIGSPHTIIDTSAFALTPWENNQKLTKKNIFGKRKKDNYGKVKNRWT